VGATTDANLRAGSAPYLEAGEQVVATLIASVRGHQQAMSGGISGMVGGQRAASARRASDAGIKLASPMGLLLTSHRLLTLQTGGRGVPKELLNTFPLVEVESMAVKRLGLGAAVTLTLRGAPIKLESRVGDARAFALELERIKTT
jgi:hypothetical protein